jgi:hypothetical protein
MAAVKRLALALVLGALALALAAAGPAEAKVAFLRTPSGNIGCYYQSSPAYLRCDILSGLKPRPARPASCDLEWGDSLTLAKKGRARLVCHGDTVFDPSAKVLRYGTTWTAGPYACISRTTGLTCENAVGHGFFMSRQRWSRF